MALAVILIVVPRGLTPRSTLAIAAEEQRQPDATGQGFFPRGLRYPPDRR